jgi:hypothetical protein
MVRWRLSILVDETMRAPLLSPAALPRGDSDIISLKDAASHFGVLSACFIAICSGVQRQLVWASGDVN